MATRARRIALFGLLMVGMVAVGVAAFRLRTPPPVAFPYGEIRIGIDASYPPFAAATADDLFGLEVDLGWALGEQLNLPVRFVNMGYDGLYDSLRADQVDIVISQLVVNPMRTGDVRYSAAYFDAGLVLVSAGERPLTTMQQVSGQRLAYEFGSASDAAARLWARRVPPFTTLPYELPEHALDAVRLGEADAALVDAISARLYLRDHEDWDATTAYVEHTPYAAAVAIDRRHTWRTLEAALRAVHEDGTLQAIIDRWL